MSDDTWGNSSGTTTENSINDPSTSFENGRGSETSTEVEVDAGTEWGTAAERNSSPDTRGPEPTGRLFAVLIGGAVGFAASFLLGLIPFLGLVLGPIGMMGGGVVAGYLRGSELTESTLTGGLAGLVGIIPSALLGLLFLSVFGFSAITEGGGEFAVGFGFIALIFLVALAFNVGLAALGGAIGSAITDRAPPS